MTAKEILYKKCAEHDGCFLSGQVGWIVEAMEEYAQQDLITKEKKEMSFDQRLLNEISKITNDYAKTNNIKL